MARSNKGIASGPKRSPLTRRGRGGGSRPVHLVALFEAAVDISMVTLAR
jgi:hypothetical protein